MYISTKDILKIYGREMKRYKWRLLVMALIVVVLTCVELVIPIFYKHFFDTVSKTGIPRDSATVALLSHYIILVLAANAVTWTLFRIALLFHDLIQPTIITNLIESSFAYLIEHSFGFFSNSFIGSLVKRITRLSRAYEVFMERVLWNLLPLGVRIIATITILFFFNKLIAIILVVWTAVFLVLNYLFSLWKLKYDIQRSAVDSEMTASLADGLTNHSSVHLFTGLLFERARLHEVAKRYRRLRQITWSMASGMEALQASLMIIVEFLLFYFGIRLWQKGLITVGDFALMQAYLIGLLIRLWDFGRTVRDLYESFADAREMAEILYQPHEITDIPKAQPLHVKSAAVEFKKITFNYHRTRAIIKNLDLTIQPGEKVALVGPSGAGKTTLVKLLFRLYDIDGGKIFIDGQNIQKVTQESLRAALSLVPQDPILFHRSLFENIAYGRRDTNQEEVYRASKLAHCDEFIQQFQYGYDTLVGERGVKLSGGERQRIAIARAILKNAPILVLDEATSSLDSESERLIQDALENLMKDKTVMVIAHRLSTIQKMDRIVVLENGQVREEGTHQELTQKEGSLYRRLWELQAGGFIGGSEEDDS